MGCKPDECVQVYIKILEQPNKKDILTDKSFKPDPHDDETYADKLKTVIEYIVRRRAPVDDPNNKPCKETDCSCFEQEYDESEEITLDSVKIDFKVAGRGTWVRFKNRKVKYVTATGYCYDPKHPESRFKIKPPEKANKEKK